MKALVLIAHGSKKEKSNQEFRDLIDEIRELNSKKYEKIESSFLEFVEPSIEEIVKKLATQNIKSITFYPFFLNSGKHVSIDIPNIVVNLKNTYPDIDFKLLQHFGLSKKIASIISEEI
ncbi:MAG: sirohydrochlorin chelatase [Arcobacter sp.]|uniref:sirohydrochlorin chelatase n=1 Tax=Arcobacter sp. TaxID=1872629 RepID=UPI003B00B2FD